MNGKNGWVIGLVMVLAPWIYGQSSLVLDLNGLSELQKVEAYVGQADRLDAQSEILFLVYATQRASEIFALLAESDFVNIDKRTLEGRLAYHWGRIYHFMGDETLAMEYLQRSIGLLSEDFLRRRSQLLLLNIQMEFARWSEALVSSERILSQDIRPLQRYNVFVQQAQIYRELERYPSAIESAQRALSLAQGDLSGEGFNALLELGFIAKAQGNIDQARDYWQRSYDIASRQANHRTMAQAFYFIAQLSMELERWDDAHYFAQRALLHLAGEDRIALFADIHYLLAQYYLAMEAFDLAFTSLSLMQQAQLRAEQQESISNRLALNLSLMRDNNEYAVSQINRKFVTQQRLNYVQLIVIVALIVAIFVLLRRVYDAQSQQRIADLAYRAINKRIRRTEGTLKVQIANMLSQDYSFGVVVVHVMNAKKILALPEGSLILEVALDNLREHLLTLKMPLESAPAIQIHTLDHLTFFYFEDQDGVNFVQDIATLPKNHQILWRKKNFTLELRYEKHFHHHGQAVKSEEIFAWLNRLHNE
ncbi:tetratricopeptide repeat protein [Entomospira culicis]|uniref:Tetratricopeptide repeat protein n=2 Tax=Entomospira culicis TaxID=2719989 RepID=A0A968GGB5_9SPIO|nr:tetratricopeptide repeat protein [Entomospira culicis]NIZ19557.1 tetratricopeptide repeat protein [Entomospira culicis]NIZ69538.1 tetratricopeptide repeat protein [Entomospira culicis]WDI38279.1 tetratricopeptide repeat protein [Entomospira culicis]